MSLRSLDEILSGIKRAAVFRQSLLAEFEPPDAVSPCMLRVIDALIVADASATVFADLARTMHDAGRNLHALGCITVAAKYSRVAAALFT